MTYTDEQKRALGLVADMIIPGSEAHGLPGAGDGAILDDILTSSTPMAVVVGLALQVLEGMSAEIGESTFTDLDAAGRSTLAEAFQAAQPELAGALSFLVFQCYYRDPRVLASLSLENRPPFPRGNEISRGDWSLLEPVKSRDPFWRKVE